MQRGVSMDWIESIEEIKKSQESDRLIIFVGAGVSANSGLPSWSQLIKDIAQKIEYKGACDKCEHICNVPDRCNKRQYTSEEYLKIPELFYQKDVSENHSDYYDFIKKELSSDAKTNQIDKEILNILPHHIITTNYDNLLETADSPNSRLYSVVCEDKDLLSNANARYILKMHGDLMKEKTIVLKESDYINYEQTHILISTFIRSLLINYTFLFVGYSLNDYNLKLIIGWINYLANQYEVSERPKNILVQYEEPSESDNTYYALRNIHIIDLHSVPDELVALTGSGDCINNDIGRKLLAYLRCVNSISVLQKFTSVERTLTERYLILKPYNKISYTDFLVASCFQNANVRGNTLFVCDYDQFDLICEVLSSDNSLIRDTFNRAQIYDVVCMGEKDTKSFHIHDTVKEDHLFKLYLDNKYQDIIKALPSEKAEAQIYYYKLFENRSIDINQLVCDDGKEISPNNIVSILCRKVRARMALLSFSNKQISLQNEILSFYETTLPSVKYSIAYLVENFVSFSNELQFHMAEILAKHEEKYAKGNHTIYCEDAFSKIFDLQTQAYNYYYFIKLNYLPVDNFINTNILFSYYLKAILSSYSHPPVSKINSLFLFENDYKHFPLNDIDIDLFVKYTDPKALKEWVKKYSVQQLEYDSCYNLEEKFINLCNCGSVYNTFGWAQQIQNFAIILCHSTNAVNNGDVIYDALIIAITLSLDSGIDIKTCIFDAVDLLTDLHSPKSVKRIKKLIDIIILTITKSFKNLYSLSRYITNIFSKLSKKVPRYTYRKIDQLLLLYDSQKQKNFILFLLRKSLPKGKYVKYILNNLNSFSEEEIFGFVADKIIPYSNQIQDIYISQISKDLDGKEKYSVDTVYPIECFNKINHFLILMLLGYSVNINALSQYKDYSKFLDFALNPDDFDYSSIDTANYMWENFIISPKYKQYFKEHRNEILTDSLENIFRFEAELRGQQKIVYGILLSDDELWKYGK